MHLCMCDGINTCVCINKWLLLHAHTRTQLQVRSCLCEWRASEVISNSHSLISSTRAFAHNQPASQSVQRSISGRSELITSFHGKSYIFALFSFSLSVRLLLNFVLPFACVYWSALITGKCSVSFATAPTRLNVS